MNVKRTVSLIALLSALLAGGCAHLGYYFQAANGQFELLNQARPIGELLDHPGTKPDLRRKLAAVLDMRAYATRELGLPDGGSYRSYADLGRPFVVWNVFATPELSVRAHEWCFPVVGCVNYRGYFAKAEAERYAAEMKAAGFDVYVAGVPAYSTLGRFDDPVLNTFIHYGEPELARLIFHELAHQVVYAAGDSEFNESFATAVETEGMRRWLAIRGNPAEQAAYDAAQVRKRDFGRQILKTRDDLRHLYASDQSDADKRAGKRRLFDQLQRDYARLKESWGGYAGYDRWFAQDLNNAQLTSVALYTRLVPAFLALLDQQKRDLPAFYREVRILAGLPAEERRARLAELVPTPPAKAAAR